MLQKPKYPYSALIDARRHSVHNGGEIIRSVICGCYQCGNIFQPKQICDWIGMDGRNMDNATAICPFCGMASVIAGSVAYPLKKDFLDHLKAYCTSQEKTAVHL